MKENEGLLKRLKNIESKNENQLGLIKDQNEKQLDLIGKTNTDRTKRIGYYNVKKKTAVDLVNKIRKAIRENRNKNFVCTHSNGTQYDFNQYIDLNQFGNEIFSDEISIEDARNEQDNMKILINKLKNYGPSNPKKIKFRQEVLDNAQKLYNIRNNIINAFENKIFFRQSDIDNITKDFSGQTDDMSELKDEKSKKENKFKQKKHSYEKWTTPIKKSNFKNIYNYVVDLVNNNKVFRIITLIPLGHFLEDINNDKFNTIYFQEQFFLNVNQH